MKSKNKIIMTILSFFVLSLAVLPNLKADIEPQDLQSAQTLADAGVIVDNSKSPQNYNLGSSITRREMLKVMLNLAGVTVNQTCEGKFADLKSSDWGCKYAETALKVGFIAANKNFRPDDAVSKVETIKMIFKAKGIEVSKTSDWRVGYIGKAVELGYTDNFSDYDSAGKRSFVFNIGAKTISSSGIIKEEFVSYEKPKLLVSFNSSMNKTSVLSNLKVYPEVSYTANWQDDKNLELVLNDIISSETNLLVNVLDSALTSSGTKLEKTYSKTFKVDGEALVEFVTPNGAISDLNQDITIRFSKPMVSLTNLDNQAKCPIEITPQIPGKCVWITTSTFQFRPESGFPTGGKYSINIPVGITTISGDKTINSKIFEITTSDFALVSNVENLGVDEPMKFAFNDEVSLDKFKANFSLNGFLNDKLKFSYYKGETDLVESKNIVSVFPISGDWGYGKKYSYTISTSMTSARGNVGLKKSVSNSIQITDFLASYNPFVFTTLDEKTKYVNSNFSLSNNQNIITKKNPNIVLNFYKEVPLDKSLFSANLPFELHYGKGFYMGQNGIFGSMDDENIDNKENKKQVVISFTGDVSDSFSLKLNLSKIASTADKTLSFSTKSNNSIVSYKQIDYKKACLETTNSVKTNLGDSFVFDKYGKVGYAYEVNEWTKDDDCSYVAGKHKYIVSTRLNPSSDYKLTIKSNLLDNDNYPLDKDYSYSFSTPVAKNEDKSVFMMDARNLILVPNEAKPLSIALQSVNLKKANIKMCVGDLDIMSENYLANSFCVTKTITLNDLGFKPNVSVVDLEKVYGKEIDKKYVRVEISKLTSDKTDNEVKYFFPSTASFIISDISATIKSAKNNILWLHNFSTGEVLTNEIKNIKSYTKQAKYSMFGSYEGQEVVFDKDISFTSKANGTYELNTTNYNTLLITLNSGEQVLIDDVYASYYQNDYIYNYITTDRPIYKAGDKVQISGISRKLSAKGYTINTAPVQVIVRDAQYKEIINQKKSLNALGAYEASFDLKSDAKLGNYSVEVGGNTLSFAVEEYEKPDFKVTASSAKDNYLFSQNAKINVDGTYYIGLPVGNGEGTYSLSSSDFYFDGGKTTGYTFGEQENFWWGIRPAYDKLGGVYYGENNVETTGNFNLDANGKKTLDIDLTESTKDKNYTLSVTVTDPNTKKSISTNTSFKGLRSDSFLGIKFDKYYYAFKDTAKIGFVVTDIEGNKLANKSFNYKVYKVDYTYNKATYNYDSSETLVLEKNISTDTTGILGQEFSFDKYGEYRFEISNGAYKTTKTIYVSGGDILRPKDAEHALGIISDKENYKVGDTAKLNISSPEIGVKALITIEKLDEVLAYKVINIDSYSKEVEIEIKKEYLPNATFGAYIIKDVATAKDALAKLKVLRPKMLELEQLLQKENENIVIPYIAYDLSIYPRNDTQSYDTGSLAQLQAYRLEESELLNQILPNYFAGSIDLKVDSEAIELSSKVTLDKTSYLPGDKQKITLNITDNSGKGITGEVTLGIIDESLLALKQNKTAIKDFFYSENYNGVQTLGNLSNLIKRIEFAVDDNVEEAAIETQAGGVMLGDLFGDVATEEATMAPEMAMDDGMAISKSVANTMYRTDGDVSNTNATRLRTELKDLAFYKTKVSVVDGKAILEVPALPDNLTTWVISGFAYTADSKVGDIQTSFKVQKELSLLPQIPRFFLNGDSGEISALVVNNTNSSKQVLVTLQMNNISSTGALQKTITVGAGASALASFPVKIETGELEKTLSTKLRLKATSGDLVDEIELTKPIYPSKTSEYVFTNGMTEDLSYEEKLDFDNVSKNGGFLEVSLGATILTNLTKNLDKVLYFPGEDLGSQLTFLENAKVLEELYKKLDKTSDFQSIILTDYNSKTHKVKEVMSLVENNIQNYLQSDNGLSYFKDCDKWWFADTCSNLNVTAQYLNLNISVSGVDNQKVISYYKNALKKQIEENKKYNIETTSITDFLPIALYKDSSFINTYFKPSETLSNIEKLDYIKLYQLLGSTDTINRVSTNKTQEYLTDLKNAVLVEARGSVLPAEKSYSSMDNSVATAKMIQILIDENSKDTINRVSTENLVRFLISNRNEEGNYYTYDFSEIIKAINKYVDFTGELKNISFEAKTNLNSKDIMTSTFGESNKFEIDKKTFNFADYLIAGENSLGFEKTGNGKLYYDVGVRYYLPVSEMTSREEGITVVRNYYNYDEYKSAFKKDCITPWWYYDFGGYCFTKKVKNIDNVNFANKGDYIVGEIEIILDKERTGVVVNDFIPAGAEILNTNFNTTSSEVKDISGQQNKNSWWQGGFDFVEQKDDRVYLYAKHLNAGTYKYTYVLKANHIGNYNLKPATAELLEKPEIWGRSSGGMFEVK